MGFYPCPPEAITALRGNLRAPAVPWSLLDPCAGNGAAVAQLAGLLGCDQANVHAIELDEGRAAKLHATLPQGHVLAPASAFGCGVTWGSLSMLWLNPPFDDEYAGGRTEADFLRHVTPWLQPGGVLALVCPERVADGWSVRQQLQQWYDRVSVRPIPEAVRQFDEVIVLAVKRQKPVERWESVEDLAPPETVYAIPPGTAPKRFEKTELTDLEFRRALAASPLQAHLTTTPEQALARPPLALGTGHVALLLASGHLDGVVKPAGEAAHVVRGTARKRTYVASCETTDNEDGSETTKTVLSEKIQLVVRAVGPDGEIHTFTDE
jgi:hypothetical protein